MREIKYRAYIKHLKTLVNVDLIDFASEEIEINTNEFNIEVYRFDEIILMQYTGLKDKDYVEIYEGDIVRVMDSTFAMVKYSDDRGAYYLDCEKKIGDVGLICQYDTIKRVGNVYETPKLLEGEE